MRDQMFAAVWNDGHERFSSDVEAGLRRVRTGAARRLSGLPDTAAHALLMVAAVVASSATLVLAVPAAGA